MLLVLVIALAALAVSALVITGARAFRVHDRLRQYPVLRDLPPQDGHADEPRVHGVSAAVTALPSPAAADGS